MQCPPLPPARPQSNGPSPSPSASRARTTKSYRSPSTRPWAPKPSASLSRAGTARSTTCTPTASACSASARASCATAPPPLECLADHPIERACPLGYALWKAERLDTVGQLEEAFALLCQRVQETLGEPAAVRYVLNHVDESDRPAMRRELLAEVAW